MKRRVSTQKGIISLKGGRLTLRYEIRSLESHRGWTWKRDYLPKGTTPTQAETYRVNKMAEINKLNSSGVITPVLTFKHFSETLWLMYLDKQDARESTRACYGSILESLFIPNFGASKLKDITSTRITQFFDAVSKRYSAKYSLNIFGLLRTMFEVALAHDLIPISPVKSKLHRPKSETKEKLSYTAEQVRAIVNALPEEHKLFVLTGAITGVRLGELLAFRWQDLNEGKLSVEHSIWRGKLGLLKTAASKRRISVNSELAFLLESNRGAADEFIFRKSDGQSLDPDFMRNKVLYPALKAAGIEVVAYQSGFHSFRHTAGSLLYDLTRDVHTVKDFLGHSRISTTSDIYIHAGDEVQRESAELLGNLLIARDVLSENSATPLVH